MANQNWKQTDVSQEEIVEILELANSLLREAQTDNEKVDYLGSHRANSEFRRMNNLREEDIYRLASTADLYDFCHYERDSRRQNEKLYCFKLSLLLSSDVEEDVLYKFKIRQENGEQVFVMSFHYPDENKEPWVHLWHR
ncbi:hypothetical protein [Intestinibacter bartlettii]|uniref:Uncharacterized protein n=1 Tax=Intestinibacter bartlettii TaxID=261299 RepID=A0ABS6DUH4_9FIRM|nr:hypothetical protein [Intestinibacter bartlettii]MBU5335469.1 hypothetical protein [Intestinibacter bartlettii]